MTLEQIVYSQCIEIHQLRAALADAERRIESLELTEAAWSAALEAVGVEAGHGHR